MLVKNVGHLEVFATIPINRENLYDRELMRKSWLRTIPHVFDYAFFVSSIKYTQSRTGDVIELPGHSDAYDKLSLKMYGIYYWVDNNINANYILKVDTDTWVSVPRLLKMLSTRTFHYGGDVSSHAQIIRKTSSLKDMDHPEWFKSDFKKWVLDDKVFQNRTYYPPYAKGGGYIMSRKFMHNFVNSAPQIIANLEDITIGLFAFRHGYRAKSLSGFVEIPIYKKKLSTCFVTNQKIILIHRAILCPITNYTPKANLFSHSQPEPYLR